MASVSVRKGGWHGLALFLIFIPESLQWSCSGLSPFVLSPSPSATRTCPMLLRPLLLRPPAAGALQARRDLQMKDNSGDDVPLEGGLNFEDSLKALGLGGGAPLPSLADLARDPQPRVERGAEADDSLGGGGSEEGRMKIGDKVQVMVKTIELSKQALAAGLDSDDLVGVVTDVWGEEEDGIIATVDFCKPGSEEKAFSSCFSSDELELWTPPAPKGTASPFPDAAQSPGLFIVANVLILPMGTLPRDMSMAACQSKVLETLLLAEGVQAQAHASGVTMIGEWDSVMAATKQASQVLLDAGASGTHLTITVSAN